MAATDHTRSPAQAVRAVAIDEWTADYRDLIVNTILKPKHRVATVPEVALFAEICQRSGLDPFARQIYGIYRKDNQDGGAETLTIQVAIDGLRLIAERTGKYQGQTPVEWSDREGRWTDVWLPSTAGEVPAAARVGVYKAGHDVPTYAVALWSEYGDTRNQWKSRPAHMLAKCAEALALRKAFPAETSGLYTPEETREAPIDAEPVREVTSGDVDPVLISMVQEVVQEGVWTRDDLDMQLVAHGAQTTDDDTAALESMTKGARDVLKNVIADAIAAADDREAVTE